MTVSMDTAEGTGEAARGGPQPTCINVHIHKESVLAKLLQSVDARLQAPKSASSSRGARLLVASWAIQIVLGLMCGTLGGILYLLEFSTVRSSGAPIWTGAVAVLAGAVAFICEKRRGIFWAFLKTLFVLAVFSTAVTAIVISANNFYDFHYLYNKDRICDISESGWPTRAPTTPSSEMDDRLKLCHSYVWSLKVIAISLHAVLLTLWSLLIISSLTPLCLFFWKTCVSKDKTDQKKPLAENRI